MTNVQKFIQLQDKANNDIDTLGQTTTETVNELEAVGNLLTEAEQDEVLMHYAKVRYGNTLDKLKD